MNRVGEYIKNKIFEHYNTKIDVVQEPFPYDKLQYKGKYIRVSPCIFNNILSETHYSSRGIVWDFESDWLHKISVELCI